MTEKLQNALNEQITAELWSANLYLSMSFYLEREGFSGMARWMQKQSAEEIGHAYAIAEYMIKREATPKVDKVDVVPQVGVTLLKYSNMLWSMKNMFPN